MKQQIFNIILKLQCKVVKLCLRYGIKHQQLAELVKVAYVNEAKDILTAQQQQTSVSRISVMTGVHRKDISKLIAGSISARKKPNFIARIISDWQHNPQFSKKNKPNKLSTVGRQSDFAKLVDSVTGGDSDPYTTLFEMQRIGAVALDEKTKLVSLLWNEYAPKVVEQDALEMLVEDTDDLYECILANIEKPQNKPANLHLKTEYTRIPEATLPKIKQWLLKEGSAFHKKISAYLAKYDLDLNHTDSKQKIDSKEFRIALGSYSFIEPKSTKEKGNK